MGCRLPQLLPGLGLPSMLDLHGSHLHSPTIVHPYRWELLIKNLIKAPGISAQNPGQELSRLEMGFGDPVPWDELGDLLHPLTAGCSPGTSAQPGPQGWTGVPRAMGSVPPHCICLGCGGWGVGAVHITPPHSSKHFTCEPRLHRRSDHMYTTIQLPRNGYRLLSHQSPSLRPARPVPGIAQ